MKPFESLQFAEQNRERNPLPSPEVSRVQNRVSAGTLMVLAGLAVSATACGGSTNEEREVIEVTEDIGCTPVPECPEPEISILAGPYEPNETFYIQDQRWFRIDPNTNDIITVCDPAPRDYCEEGETPQEDGCDPPLCEGVQEAMCDPVLSRPADGAYRNPSQADYPTGVVSQYTRTYILNNKTQYPVIYDNTPDCGPGESPDGETYYVCDVIPTCEETIDYCDPLPRCAEGQSPIVCSEENAQRYTTEEQCRDYLYNEVQQLSVHGFSTDELLDIPCEPTYDESINEDVYVMPDIEVVCRVAPECEEGEVPARVTQTVPLDCGQWGNYTSVSDYAISCDPIRSCD